jgi:hypothetical protein
MHHHICGALGVSRTTLAFCLTASVTRVLEKDNIYRQ